MRTISPISTPEPSRSVDRDVASRAIIAQFRAALRELRCMGTDRMRRLGVSHTHFQVVSLLDRHGEMPMSRLADMLDVSLPNASGLVDRLEEAGYVERSRDAEDRRVVIVRSTDAGRQKLAEADVLKDEMVQGLLDRLDDGQLARLAAAVEDLTVAARDAFPELAQHDHIH